MIYFYRFFYAFLLPFYIFFGFIFVKKIRNWLLHRPSELRKKSSRKAIWIHASSGEFEHAKSIIRRLKKDFPFERVVVSYSSPSYHNAIAKFPDVDEYVALPVDTKPQCLSIIKKINPKCVLFARTDVWPELVHQLKRKEVPTLLFAHVKNSPIGFFTKIAAQLTWSKLSHISCVSQIDKDHLSRAVNTPLSVDGDPRYDEVFFRQKNSSLSQDISKTPKTLVIGSCWPEDYKAIKPSLNRLLKDGVLQKIIFAPHELDPTFIQEVEEDFSSFGVGYFSKKDFDRSFLIVDEMGVLFELYNLGDLAFVGGSFKRKVHSVLEPLSWGLPTLVGPKHLNSYEAKHYSQKGYVNIVQDKDSFFEAVKNSFKLDREEIHQSLLAESRSSKKIIDLLLTAPFNL